MIKLNSAEYKIMVDYEAGNVDYDKALILLQEAGMSEDEADEYLQGMRNWK